MSLKKKDTAISFAGVVAGQAVLFLCIAIIGREWGSIELGKFNFNVNIAMFIGTIMAFRYELACVAETEQRSSAALVNACLIALASFSFLYLATVLSGKEQYQTALIFALTFLIQQACNHYLNTCRKYALIGIIKVFTNITFASLLAIAVTLKKLNDTFVMYTIANLILTTITLFIILKHQKPEKPNIKFLCENISLAKYTLPATLLNSALLYSLPIIIPFLFGDMTAGYFAATQRFGFFPVSLIAQSIGGIVRRESITAIHNDKDAKGLFAIYKSYAILLILLAIAYLITGCILFDFLVKIVFDDSWHQATVFFYILAPLYALQMIYIPLSQILLATQNQRTDLLIQAIIFFSTISSLTLSYTLSLSPSATLMAYSLSNVISILIGLLITLNIAKSKQ